MAWMVRYGHDAMSPLFMESLLLVEDHLTRYAAHG